MANPKVRLVKGANVPSLPEHRSVPEFVGKHLTFVPTEVAYLCRKGAENRLRAIDITMMHFIVEHSIPNDNPKAIHGQRRKALGLDEPGRDRWLWWGCRRIGEAMGGYHRDTIQKSLKRLRTVGLLVQCEMSNGDDLLKTYGKAVVIESPMWTKLKWLRLQAKAKAKGQAK